MAAEIKTRMASNSAQGATKPTITVGSGQQVKQDGGGCC